MFANEADGSVPFMKIDGFRSIYPSSELSDWFVISHAFNQQWTNGSGGTCELENYR
jgi:hypothetical protein